MDDDYKDENWVPEVEPDSNVEVIG